MIRHGSVPILLAVLLTVTPAFGQGKKSLKIKDGDQIIEATLGTGQVQCMKNAKGKIIAGKVSRSGKKFAPSSAKSSTKIKRLKSKAAALAEDGAPAKKVKRLKKKIKKLRANLKAAKAACVEAFNPDTTPVDPNPTPQPTPEATPNPPVDPPVPPVAAQCSLEPYDDAVVHAHLYTLFARAGYGMGAREREILTLGLTEGIPRAVEEFMRYVPESQAQLDTILDWRDGLLDNEDDLLRGGERNFSREGLRRAWVSRMTTTQSAFREKLAFFLLGLWTAGDETIPGGLELPLVWRYLELLRASAQNPDMRQLGKDASIEPMMLYYLDGDQNTAEAPNENFGREVMELFTIGTENQFGEANYTEIQDIPEVAKAFTGWSIDFTRVPHPTNPMLEVRQYESVFTLDDFVPGTKTFFSGAAHEQVVVSYTQAIDALFNHPHASRYYATEILQEYLSRTPPECIVEQFAELIEQHDFNLEEPMRILLSSQAFYHPAYANDTTRDSLEFMVSFVRSLALPVRIDRITNDLRIRLSMSITSPPSVFWWPFETWSSPPTLLGRANVVSRMFSDSTVLDGDPETTDDDWDPGYLCPEGDGASADELIDVVYDRLGLRRPEGDAREQLRFYVNSRRSSSGAITEEPYDNSLIDHQIRKCQGLYFIAALGDEFMTK